MKPLVLYAGIAVVLLVLVFWLARNDWVRNSIDGLLIPKEVENYPTLTDQPLTSGDVELVKLLDGRVDTLVWDQVDGKIVIHRAAFYDLNQEAAQWHLSSDGNIFEKADVLEEIPTPMHPDLGEGRYEVMLNYITLHHSWTNEEEPLSLGYFVKEKRQSTSFYDMNNTSRSGWNGTGYFYLRSGKDGIGFKTYAFWGDQRYAPDIQLYSLPEGSPDGFLMVVDKPAKSKRNDEEIGLYLIRAIDGT